MSTPSLQFASTFLSHASTDKPLVEAVAQRLGRRGVLAWLDKTELALGSLSAALKQAVQQQTTVTLFLSEAAIASPWCQDELLYALETANNLEHLLPVYLGDPVGLVTKHPTLRSRFLHPDGDRVDQLGVFDSSNPASPDPDTVAEKIAATVYQRLAMESSPEVAIVLDQRGNGPRRGYPPAIPKNLQSLSIPALAFRPDMGIRQQRELLAGGDWEDMSQTMVSALNAALGTLRGDSRKVRILGNAQTGLMWAIGQHFNRTTSADLYVYGKEGLPLSNKGQIRHTSLSGGSPRATLLSGQLGPGATQREIALGVGPSEKFKGAVQKAVPQTPLFWVESGFIESSEQAMTLAADIVASVEQLRRTHGVEQVVMFWTTANHAATLAAANLTSHVVASIKYMEWNHENGEYVHLPMPQ